MESRPSPRTKPRGNHVSSRGWLPNRVPKQPQLWGAGPGGHGTARRPRALPVQLTRELNAGLNSRRVKAGLLSVNSCERLEGVGSEAYPHQKATMPGPPKRCPSGGSWHLSESGTDTNRPAKTWVRYRRCRDAVPAGPSREGQAPPRVWFKVPLPRGLSANGSRSGPASDADSTTLSIWSIWNPDPDPGQTDAAHSSTDRDLPRSVQRCNLCLTTCLHSPLAARQLNSTTWIQDHKSHLPRHNK